MTVLEPKFSNGAVGVAFLDPEQTGTIHLTVAPETGAIVLAEAHPVRLRGDNVPREILDELGNTATALISEYVSNYLSNASQNNNNVSAEDPAFKNLLGQSISGLDQMLIDTVSDKANLAAYRMDDSTQQFKIKSSAPNSLLSKITNSLEAIVYYDGGIHISHRGESQQYLVGSKRVQKLTKDHIAGGLFSKIGDLGDFIPQVHTNTLPMNTRDLLVIFSKEAALSSFPVNQLAQWLGDGDPVEQAQRVAGELYNLGKRRGCVIVFAPGHNGGSSDDIVSKGMFSLMNLANLERGHTGEVAVISETNTDESEEASVSSAAARTARKSGAGSTISGAKKRNSSLKLRSRPSLTAERTTPWKTTPEPLESRAPKRRSLVSSPTVPDSNTIEAISKVVMDQMAEKLNIDAVSGDLMEKMTTSMEELETQIHTDVNERLSKMRKDILSRASKEVEKKLKTWADEKLTELEGTMMVQLQDDLTAMEMRLSAMMGKVVSGLRAEFLNQPPVATAAQPPMTQSPQDSGDDASVLPPALQNKSLNDTDELEIQELQTVENDDIQFSTIPGAIFGSSRPPDKPKKLPPLSRSMPSPVKDVPSLNNTLPAPPVFQPIASDDTLSRVLDAALPDEEITAVGSSKEIEALTDQASVPSTPPTVPREDRRISTHAQQSAGADQSASGTDSLSSVYTIPPSRKTRIGVTAVIVLLLAGAGVVLLLSPYSPVTFFKSDSSAGTAPVPESSTNTEPMNPTPAEQAHPGADELGEESQALQTAGVVPGSSAAVAGENRATPDETAAPDDDSSEAAAGNDESPEEVDESEPPDEKTDEMADEPMSAESPYNIVPDAVMNVSALYDRGMELYNIGDSGKDNGKRLTREERREVLTSALEHFKKAIHRKGAVPNNLWYVKGRTEYNLAKIERSKDQRKTYAKAALKSYSRYMDEANSISKAKEKTIKRNQKKLKTMTKD
jgi:hypothetical protein